MNDNDKQQGPENNGNPWMKSLLIWVGILAALALFVQFFDTRSTQSAGTTIPYSTFLDKVQEGSVKDVNVSQSVITGTFTNDGKFRTNTVPDPQLIPTLPPNWSSVCPSLAVRFACWAQSGPDRTKT